jgi:hypothetical protein
MTRIGFTDLFDRLGTADLGYSPLARSLSGSEVEIAGFLVAMHDGADRVVLTDAPGTCPDCAPAPVPAVHLPGFRTPAAGEGALAVRVRGRLSYGFAVAADGYASFLRLENARVATGLRCG